MSKTTSVNSLSPILAPSPRLTPKKILFVATFGLICYISGTYHNYINNNVFNRVKVLVGLRPHYHYATPVRPQSAETTLNFPQNPDPWLLSIAQLMTQFYGTLHLMGQWPADAEVLENVTAATPLALAALSQTNLSPAAIDILYLLPYTSPVYYESPLGGDSRTLLIETQALDYRSADRISESRDPLYASPDDNASYSDENGPYMRPDYVALTALGNHGIVLILNLAQRTLWLMDQEGGNNADPGLPQYDSYATSQRSLNSNLLDFHPARPAEEVLPDLISRFEKLEYLPCGLYRNSYEGDALAELYTEHDWPDREKFSARKDEFLASWKVWQEQDLRQRTAEQPFEELENKKSWLREMRVYGAQYRIEQLKEKERAGWNNSEIVFQNEQDWRNWIDTEFKRYNRELATEPERARALEKEIELLEEEVAAVPEAIRKARESRIAKYGW